MPKTVGEKLPISVIGKATKPRYFPGIRSLSRHCKKQKISWMGGLLFEMEMERKFEVGIYPQI